MSSTIKHPRPDNKSTQSSNRLLSSHLSVLEALQSTDGGNDGNELNHQRGINNQNNMIEDGFNPQFNNFENHQNTPTLNEFEFNSSTSWHSIGDYLAPRPTSSVLSSSDTEEDEQVDNQSQRLAIESHSSHHPSFQDSDEKTIEINLNGSFLSSSPLKRKPFMEGSSFVLPQMFSPESVTSDDVDSKILIIGHKKQNFLHGLDQQLRKRFTLDHEKISDYNIILVIFDGLIKIGNILNFIKNLDGTQLEKKSFIPIVKNINMKVIDKILRNYDINLLCSPISLENQIELNNLINVLKEDYLTKDSLSMIPLQDNDQIKRNERLYAFEQEANSYQLIRIYSEVEEEPSASSTNQLLSLGKTNDGSTNELDQSQDKKIVMIKNTPYEIIHHKSKSKKSSKKLLKKKQIQKNFLLLGMSLSVGIGIGITTALTLSFLRSTPTMEPPTKPPSDLKNLTKLIVSDKLKLNTLMKQNLINFKQHVTDISSLMYNQSKDYVLKVGTIWDQFVVSASHGFNGNSGGFLWYF